MPNTDEPSGWLELLSLLTDEELHRYGEIARDQRDLEYDKWSGQILCMIGAAATLAWALWRIVVSGVTTEALVGLAATVALGYWPYRKLKTRRLWEGHRVAVAREQARRGIGAG